MLDADSPLTWLKFRVNVGDLAWIGYDKPIITRFYFSAKELDTHKFI